MRRGVRRKPKRRTAWETERARRRRWALGISSLLASPSAPLPPAPASDINQYFADFYMINCGQGAASLRQRRFHAACRRRSCRVPPGASSTRTTCSGGVSVARCSQRLPCSQALCDRAEQLRNTHDAARGCSVLKHVCVHRGASPLKQEVSEGCVSPHCKPGWLCWFTCHTNTRLHTHTQPGAC